MPRADTHGIDLPVQEIWFWENPETGKGRKRGLRREEEELDGENTFAGDELDPRDTLRELIMAELPDLPKCAEDCKGLCPKCGANLNEETCECDVASGKTESGENSEGDPPSDSDWKQAMKSLRDKL